MSRLMRTAVLVGFAVLVFWGVSALLGNDGSSFTLQAPEGRETRLDLGEPGPSVGDVVVLSGRLVDGDDAAGRLDGECRVVSDAGDRDQERRRCSLTATIGTENGETELQLQAVRRAAADEVRFSVTGGSGEHAGASGEAIVDHGDGDNPVIAFELHD